MPLYAPPPIPRLVAGRYYCTTPGTNATTGTPTQSRLRVLSWDLDRYAVIDRIGGVVTVGAASATLRWGVWADSGADGPGVLLVDTGAVGDASTTGWKEATVALSLAAGRYWVGTVAQGGNPTTANTNNVGLGPVSWASSADIVTANQGTGRFLDGVTGALSSSPAMSAVPVVNAPFVYVRAA
jgi:hypothetical protein